MGSILKHIFCCFCTNKLDRYGDFKTLVILFSFFSQQTVNRTAEESTFGRIKLPFIFQPLQFQFFTGVAFELDCAHASINRRLLRRFVARSSLLPADPDFWCIGSCISMWQTMSHMHPRALWTSCRLFRTSGCDLSLSQPEQASNIFPQIIEADETDNLHSPVSCFMEQYTWLPSSLKRKIFVRLCKTLQLWDVDSGWQAKQQKPSLMLLTGSWEQQSQGSALPDGCACFSRTCLLSCFAFGLVLNSHLLPGNLRLRNPLGNYAFELDTACFEQLHCCMA